MRRHWPEMQRHVFRLWLGRHSHARLRVLIECAMAIGKTSGARMRSGTRSIWVADRGGWLRGGKTWKSEITQAGK
jgi:hypothetical protein